MNLIKGFVALITPGGLEKGLLDAMREGVQEAHESVLMGGVSINDPRSLLTKARLMGGDSVTVVRCRDGKTMVAKRSSHFPDSVTISYLDADGYQAKDYEKIKYFVADIKRGIYRK